METRNILIHVLLDLFTGLLASGAYTLFSTFTFNWRGMGTMFAAAGLFFLCTGFVRGRSLPAHSALKALLLAVPFGIDLIFWVFVRFELVIEETIAFIGAITGIYASRIWKTGGRTRSLLILGTAVGTLDLVSLVVAPIWG
jgi:hypothetical protein